MTVNPYAPPTPGDETQSHFYKTVVKNLTVAELWRILSPNLFNFAIGLIVKTFRLNLPLYNAFAFADLIRVEFDAVPESVSNYFERARIDLRALGYSPLFSIFVPMLGEGELYAQVFIGPKRDRVAGCIYARTVSGMVEEVTTAVSISSRSNDGKIHTTTNSRKHLNPPPSVEWLRQTNAGMHKLDQAHTSSIGRLPWNSLVEFNIDSAWKLLIDNAEIEVDFNVGRGIYCPITDDEFAHLRKISYFSR